MILIILFLAACFLSFSNGSNDNFKGVATLFGSQTTSYKGAIIWATVTTFLGSIAAIYLADTLVKNFSGKGLVPDQLIQSPEFAIAIATGAGITVFIATKISMPISTTHSLVGALFGSGLVAVGSAFNFEKLIHAFLIPLIVSPLMATIVSFVAYTLFKYILKPKDTTNTQGSNQKTALDYAHYISAGIVSFARGLNDTPKIVGLLVVINALDIKWGMLAIALTIALGGLLKAKKVGEMMSKKITNMNSQEGFIANLVTGLLVTTASIHGMPVSTTHVSVGSIFGIGTATKQANPSVIRNILLSWFLTLPIAALISGLTYWLIQQF